MTALRIVLPLGIVAIIAGLVIGNTNISLASAQGISCSSAFGGGSGTLDINVEAACAPLLSEHQLWATVFLVLGVGLLISALVLYRAKPAHHAADEDSASAFRCNETWLVPRSSGHRQGALLERQSVE
jgi:hypothetical protein